MRARFYVREFLNQPGFHGGAHILVEVPESNDTWEHITFHIADCARSVELDFPMNSREQRENSLAKADLLADVVAAFRDALADYVRAVEAAEQSEGC